jgi:hypothetical protein
MTRRGSEHLERQAAQATAAAKVDEELRVHLEMRVEA